VPVSRDSALQSLTQIQPHPFFHHAFHVLHLLPNVSNLLVKRFRLLPQTVLLLRPNFDVSRLLATTLLASERFRRGLRLWRSLLFEEGQKARDACPYPLA
jgi:hypothetical protein